MATVTNRPPALTLRGLVASDGDDAGQTSPSVKSGEPSAEFRVTRLLEEGV